MNNERNLKEGYFLYILVRAIGFFIRLIPLSAALFLGRQTGLLLYYLKATRRRIAYANLRMALSKEKSPEQLRRILKSTFKNFGMNLVEVLRIPKMDTEYINTHIKLKDFHKLDEVLENKKGVILLTAHFGNWELSPVALGENKYKMKILAREQNPPLLNELLNSYRESKGCKVIAKGFETKELIRGLRNNEIIGMLVDQNAGKEGVFINLFGRPASTHRGPIQFALKTDCNMLAGFMVRTHRSRHEVVIEDKIDILKDLPEDEAVKDGMQKFNDILESYIRKYPDQWLWMHRRWKATTQRQVVILNDKKAGHLNQSLAILEAIKKARSSYGFKPTDTAYKIVDIEFKNKFMRILFGIAVKFSSKNCQGCMRCLKVTLKKSSYDELMHSYADMVISSGSLTAGVNVLYSYENSAKNAVVMKPGRLSLKRFNLAVIPKHDNPKPLPNVIITAGAPNLIDENLMAQHAEFLKKQFSLEAKTPTIGALIGGDTKQHRLSVDIIKAVVEQLKLAADYLDAQVLITTSRRTPKETEEFLKQQFNGYPRCKLLIIASHHNPKETVAGILGLSDLIVVSEESVTMVSEAISSGKRIVVFPLESIKGEAEKHKLALKSFVEDGLIYTADTQNLAQVLQEAYKDKSPAKHIDDNKKVQEAVKRII